MKHLIFNGIPDIIQKKKYIKNFFNTTQERKGVHTLTLKTPVFSVSERHF